MLRQEDTGCCLIKMKNEYAKQDARYSSLSEETPTIILPGGLICTPVCDLPNNI